MQQYHVFFKLNPKEFQGLSKDLNGWHFGGMVEGPEAAWSAMLRVRAKGHIAKVCKPIKMIEAPKVDLNQFVEQPNG